MIDFSKISSGPTVDTILHPREIFTALPSKKSSKFQYPRDVQTQVWNKWTERKNETNLVIKMNTGGGKTVVGLLILKSCLNEGKYPAVYVCPDNFLVKQVMDAAKELGIEVTDNAHNHRFISGRSILVINIYKLANGKSVFGVGDEGIKQSISSLVIDDAHACLDTVEDQFTIELPRESSLYNEIYGVFKNDLNQICENKVIEIENRDPSSYIQVPYWVWQKKITDINKILINYSDTEPLKFVWPLVKDNIKFSHCVVSSSCIEIAPHCIPIHSIPSIVEADRKIFMTATLVNDSILSSHFAVPNDSIEKPIVPESAGDIGDRMILLPQAINPNTVDDDIKDYCNQFSKDYNVVVIVPSQYRASYWRDIAQLTLTSENLYDGINQLKNEHVGLVVLINKYDGIDLPGEACRLLVIDGMPETRRKIDLVKQGILMGTSSHASQIVQRIEQGMGRGVRSNDDYCVVFLIGKDLTKQLYSKGATDKLSPSAKAQLEVSDQISEQIRGDKLNQITDTLDYCLKQNQQWITKSKGALAGLKYSETNELDQTILALRNAYDFASINDINRAIRALENLVNNIKDKKESGYIKQIFAEYVNLKDIVEAQKIQKSAINDNYRVLKPIEGIEYHKISSKQGTSQAALCKDYLTKKNIYANELIIEVDGILSNLIFKVGSSGLFEESMYKIATILGFDSQRPEQKYNKGPDNLWKLGESNYFIIECKNGAISDKISKNYCNQLSGSCNWFKEIYGNTVSYVPILVHPSSIIEYTASPEQDTRIMDKSRLEEFCTSVRNFIRSIASNHKFNDIQAIESSLIAHKLRACDLANNYTVAYKIKNK